MSYKAMAEAALTKRAQLVTELRSVNENKGLTDSYKESLADRLNTEIEALTEEARSAVEDGEREREARDLFGKAGNLVIPGGGKHTEVRMNVPMRSGQSFGDIAGTASDNEFGEYLRDMAFGLQTRAQSEGVGTEGGVLVPTKLSASVLDLARAHSATAAAGAAIVPLSSKTNDFPVLTGDAVAAWRAENGAVAESQAAFAPVTFTAKGLAVLVKAPWELMEDSIGDFGATLRDAFAKSFGVALDKAALYGAGTATEPKGLTKVTAVTKATMGANGAALTDYGPIITGTAAVRGANYEPTAYITAERTAASLANLKATANGQYLTPPAYLDGVKHVRSANVPINLTQGTATNASDIIVGDFGLLGIGIRTAFEIRVLRERYADNGQVGFIGWLRADVQPFRTDAFHITNGIIP
jgi:HK97 family phage major capsid protein